MTWWHGSGTKDVHTVLGSMVGRRGLSHAVRGGVARAMLRGSVGLGGMGGKGRTRFWEEWWVGRGSGHAVGQGRKKILGVLRQWCMVERLHPVVPELHGSPLWQMKGSEAEAVAKTLVVLFTPWVLDPDMAHEFVGVASALPAQRQEPQSGGGWGEALTRILEKGLLCTLTRQLMDNFLAVYVVRYPNSNADDGPDSDAGVSDVDLEPSAAQRGRCGEWDCCWVAAGWCRQSSAECVVGKQRCWGGTAEGQEVRETRGVSGRSVARRGVDRFCRGKAKEEVWGREKKGNKNQVWLGGVAQAKIRGENPRE